MKEYENKFTLTITTPFQLDIEDVVSIVKEIENNFVEFVQEIRDTKFTEEEADSFECILEEINDND